MHLFCPALCFFACILLALFCLSLFVCLAFSCCPLNLVYFGVAVPIVVVGGGGGGGGRRCVRVCERRKIIIKETFLYGHYYICMHGQHRSTLQRHQQL